MTLKFQESQFLHSVYFLACHLLWQLPVSIFAANVKVKMKGIQWNPCKIKQWRSHVSRTSFTPRSTAASAACRFLRCRFGGLQTSEATARKKTCNLSAVRKLSCLQTLLILQDFYKVIIKAMPPPCQHIVQWPISMSLKKLFLTVLRLATL